MAPLDTQKLSGAGEAGAPPTPAKSTLSASASLWSEKPRLPDLPGLSSPDGEFLCGLCIDANTDRSHTVPTKPANPITKNIEGLKGDEAIKSVMDAWDQAVKTRAPELKIVVGIGKPGTQLKRRITKALEDR